MQKFYNTNLPANLRVLKEEIEGYARDYGLDFYETIFEVVDADDLNEIAAYGGFPTRYPHWSFGMQYEELSKSYSYGLSKIYEMVINNDPCYAYLMRCNHVVDQKLVMAHVYGHCLAPETKIETSEGVKPIADIKEGELVLTHTGHYRPVKAAVRRQHTGPIYKITVGGINQAVRITGEHPVLVVKAAGQPQWIPASEVKVGDWVCSPRKSLRAASVSERFFGRTARRERAGSLFLSAPSVRVWASLLISSSQSLCDGLGSWPARSRSGHLFRTGTLTPCRSPMSDREDLARPTKLQVRSAGSDAEYLYQPVRSVETEPYSDYVYNFSVDVDESYTLAAGFAVHNCDFFKNNAYFGHTTRKMMDEIANHASRIRQYVERFGEDEVEAFMDRCMSIDDLIDIHSVAIKRRGEHSRYDFKQSDDEPGPEDAPKFRSKPYMDGYVNPRGKADDEAKKNSDKPNVVQFPDRPEKDVLLFLIEHAPLKNWQRDILSIVRDEAYYFYPQAQTKIINEGWASFWHSTIMTQKVLEGSELIDYADHHSGTMATSSRRLNPYKLGIELLRDIEFRWNTGRFGPEWDECDDLEAKRNWKRDLGLGRDKIYEVRRIHNDITFIDTFLTPDFCVQHNLFSFNYQDSTKNYVIESREFQKVKQRLLSSLTNFGKPWIYVINGNHRNRGELLLRHEYTGVELNKQEARDTLANLYFIWGRPVSIETVIDDKPSVLSFDGTDHTQAVIGAENDPRRNPAKPTK